MDNVTPPAVEPILLKPPQAAQVLGIGKRKLWSMTAGGEIPHVRIGKSVRYSVDSLRDWVAGQLQEGRR